MPLNVVWHDEEKSIITATGEGEWTWDEYHQQVQTIVAMCRSVPHRVDLIYVQGSGSTRPEGSSIPHYKKAMAAMPPNVGLHVLLKDNLLVRTFLSVFTRLYGRSAEGKFTVAATLEDAIKLIAQDRQREQSAVQAAQDR